MKKELFIFLTCFCAAVLAGPGCARYSEEMLSVMAVNVQDLREARQDGIKRTYNIPWDQAFDKVKKIIKKEKLVLYQSSRKEKYMVVMGFPKQVDTTRAGIFFKPVSEKSTAVTISSLSSTALPKAEDLILDKLSVN